MTERAFHELRLLAEELRQAFADERAAIAKLDHERLLYLASHKQDIVRRLDAARSALPGPSPELRDLFHALRLELHANAMLASTAATAVRTLLGYEQTGAYDHRAKRLTSQPTRRIATY